MGARPGEQHLYDETPSERRARETIEARFDAERQILAACIAYVRKGPNFDTWHYPGDVSRKWRGTSGYVGDTYGLPPDCAATVKQAIRDALAAAALVAAVERAGKLGVFSAALEDGEHRVADILVSAGLLAWRKPGTEDECLTFASGKAS